MESIDHISKTSKMVGGVLALALTIGTGIGTAISLSDSVTENENDLQRLEQTTEEHYAESSDKFHEIRKTFELELQRQKLEHKYERERRQWERERAASKSVEHAPVEPTEPVERGLRTGSDELEQDARNF